MKPAKGYDYRLRLLSIGVILFSLLLVGKLYLVQIVSGDIYKEKAEHQYVVGDNYFDRGSVFFTTKEGVLVPAATVKSGFILAINPRVLAEKGIRDEAYQKLAEVIELEESEWDKRANKTSDTYEELLHKLPAETADKVRELNIPGVGVYRERWRVYPGGSMAAHALGLIGYSGHELGGRYGLEYQYENVLERKGDTAFVNFFAEVFSNIKKSITPGESPEGDIVTTIEPSVQAYLEDELEKVGTKYGSEWTGGIIVNPKTGAIYAMALHPTFDPNAPQDQANSAVFRNKFLEDRYEMGSIVKALTVAAGIDAGAISARTTYNDPGCMTLNTKSFCNYDGKSHGSAVTMQEALSKSLNTGMAEAVRRMGNTTFRNYMLAFGLGEASGIDLPYEGKSLVANLNSSRDLEYAQASFGQGIALTPITTVRALSALANGGILTTPHLVSEIRHKIGTYDTIEYPMGKQVLNPETSEEISRMLTHSVDHSLRDGTVRLESYSVAAKTGTAQIAKADGGGYYDDRYLHSFFGYFPSYDPEFLVFLYTYYPKGVNFASETLTDTFMNTTKFIINYYNIPPDREAPPASLTQI